MGRSGKQPALGIRSNGADVESTGTEGTVSWGASPVNGGKFILLVLGPTSPDKAHWSGMLSLASCYHTLRIGVRWHRINSTDSGSQESGRAHLFIAGVRQTFTYQPRNQGMASSGTLCCLSFTDSSHLISWHHQSPGSRIGSPLTPGEVNTAHAFLSSPKGFPLGMCYQLKLVNWLSPTYPPIFIIFIGSSLWVGVPVFWPCFHLRGTQQLDCTCFWLTCWTRSYPSLTSSPWRVSSLESIPG